jgi:hypothetical protein
MWLQVAGHVFTFPYKKFFNGEDRIFATAQCAIAEDGQRFRMCDGLRA